MNKKIRNWVFTKENYQEKTCKVNNFHIFLQKRKIWQTQIFTKLVVSLKVIELQRCTIPHFKALALLFWPLAWLLTLGPIIFAIWSKTFVHFFMRQPLSESLGQMGQKRLGVWSNEEQKSSFVILWHFTRSAL